MNILIAYLGIGLVVALAGIPQGFLNPENKLWQHVVGVVFAAALWPFTGYLLVRWLIKKNEGPRCAFCGHEGARTPDEIRAHILVCEQHPMRAEIKRVKAAIAWKSATIHQPDHGDWVLVARRYTDDEGDDFEEYGIGFFLAGDWCVKGDPNFAVTHWRDIEVEE